MSYTALDILADIRKLLTEEIVATNRRSIATTIWHYRPGTAPCGTGPIDGVCACALAFSTLLSSQGADAHHQETFESVWGNPANLPCGQVFVKSASRFNFSLLTATRHDLTVVQDPKILSYYLDSTGEPDRSATRRPPGSHPAEENIREAWRQCQIEVATSSRLVPWGEVRPANSVFLGLF
jgi:hypothetical protein